MTRRVLPAGDRAVLVELDSLDEVLAFDAALASRPTAEIIDVVPAARTVLVRGAAGVDLDALAGRLSVLPIAATATLASTSVIEVPTIYDGADLAAVADALQVTTAEVVAAHSAQPWTVAFCGFAPGFAYLVGSHAGLNGLPRRAEPRTRVPAGSVAVAAGFSAIYPRASPGGWQLLGRTELAVFDVDRSPPALLPPGTRVRFVPS